MAVNGVGFDLRAVQAKDDGIVRKVLSGTDGKLYGLAISYSNLNVTIQPGWFIVAGRLVQIDEALTIPIVATGNTYARLRFKIDLTIAASASTFTQGSFIWDVNSGGTFAALTQNDIYAAGTVYEFQFCVVQITSSIVVGVTSQLAQIKSTNTHSLTATLVAASWTGASAPFSQDVTVAGITADSIATVALAMNATSAEITVAQKASLLATAQTTNTITVKAYGTKPTINVPIQIVIQG